MQTIKIKIDGQEFSEPKKHSKDKFKFSSEKKQKIEKWNDIKIKDTKKSKIDLKLQSNSKSQSRRNENVKKEVKQSLGKKIFGYCLFTLLGLVVAIGIYSYFTIYVPYTNIRTNLNDIQAIASSIRSDLDQKDASKLDDKIAQAKLELKQINSEIQSLSTVKGIPVAAGYLNNADKAMAIGDQAFVIIDKSLPSIKKSLNSMGYKTANNANGKNLNDDQRIEALIQEIPEFANTYRVVEPDVLILLDEISKLDPDYLPGSAGEQLKPLIQQLKGSTKEVKLLSDKIKETLDILPKLMGADGNSKYLILFNNENELRASGGMMSAYGFMDVSKGKVGDKIEANDTWFIHNSLNYTYGINVRLFNPSGQAYWMAGNGVECGGAEMRVQDSGVYPDNIVNMNTFAKYYDSLNKVNPKEFPAYDASIVITTDFAADLVKLVEPLDMPTYNRVLTSQNLAEEMSKETEKANKVFATGTKERKTFVKDVATALKDKITKNSSVELFPKLIASVLQGFQQKHVFMYSKDEALQNYFDKWGVTGEIARNFDGDYLNISEAQICGLKSNLYVKDKVTQNIEIGKDNSVTHDVKIDWENDKIPRPDQENTFAFNFPYSAWVRLFVPKDSEFISNEKGIYPVSKDYLDKKLDKHTIENVFQMRWRKTQNEPPASYTLENKYKSSAKYDLEKGYRLLIQKHPGKYDEEYTLNITHNDISVKETFKLDRDKVVTFKAGKLVVENYDVRLDSIVEFFK